MSIPRDSKRMKNGIVSEENREVTIFWQRQLHRGVGVQIHSELPEIYLVRFQIIGSIANPRKEIPIFHVGTMLALDYMPALGDREEPICAEMIADRLKKDHPDLRFTHVWPSTLALDQTLPAVMLQYRYKEE